MRLPMELPSEPIGMILNERVLMSDAWLKIRRYL